MGLELVELTIKLEEAFGITIPDEVAPRLTTPREVTDYILTRVPVGDQPSCLSQQAFYFLRAKFVPHLRLSRKDFRPTTPLEHLIPRENRRRVWSGLKTEVGASAMPDLARPAWLFSLLTLATILSFIYAAIYTSHNFDAGLSASIFFGILAAIAVGYGSAVLTRPLKGVFRRGYERVGDIAKYASVNSPHSFKKERRGWTREQVAAVVREIIVNETGVRDFTEDSHFIKDMHLD